MAARTRKFSFLAAAFVAGMLFFGHSAAASGGGESHGPTPVNWFDLGYKDKDAHGETLDPGEEPMSAPFAFLLMNFGIVVFVLAWKVRPAIGRFAKDRHTTIKEALEESAKLREQAKNKLAEYESKIQDAEAEVDKLIADIRADAEAERKRIIEQAEKQAAAMKRDADERIAAEIDRARVELEREIVAAAIATAEKILREKTTPTDKKKLFDSFVAELDSEHMQERIEW